MPYKCPHCLALNSTFQPGLKHHQIFLLGTERQEQAPSTGGKFKLQQCGLGKRKICFHSKAKVAEFQRKLEEEFPKFKAVGGFVIMRTGLNGSNNLLAVVSPLSWGNSVLFLKDCSRLGPGDHYKGI